MSIIFYIYLYNLIIYKYLPINLKYLHTVSVSLPLPNPSLTPYASNKSLTSFRTKQQNKNNLAILPCCLKIFSPS